MASLALSTSKTVLHNGALGIKKLVQNEEAQIVLRFGLSFIVPESIIESFFDSINENALEKEIARIGEKMDKLIGEAQSSSIQLLRDAFIAYESQNYEEAAKIFYDVKQIAYRAFNLASNLEGQIVSTQLKITSTFMNKSFIHGSGMKFFDSFAIEKQREIAKTIQGQVDDLLEKSDSSKSDIIRKAKQTFLDRKRKTIEAGQKIREIDNEVNKVLIRTYPLLAQGLEWIKPKSRISIKNTYFTFEVYPKYVPEGRDHSVEVIIASKPELKINLHKKLDFSYESLDLNGLQVLTWTLNGVMHQKIFKASKGPMNDEPLCLQVEKEELALAFKNQLKKKLNNKRRYTVGALDEISQAVHKFNFGEARNMGKIEDEPNSDSELMMENKLIYKKCEKQAEISETLCSEENKYHIEPYKCNICDKDLKNSEILPRFQNKVLFCNEEEKFLNIIKQTPIKCNICNQLCQLYYFKYKNLKLCDKDFKNLRNLDFNRSDDKDTTEHKSFNGEQQIQTSERRIKKKLSLVTCDECKEVITDTFYIYDNLRLCKNDHEKYVKRCSLCNQEISDSFYTDKDGNIFCLEDYKKTKGTLNCQKCGDEIRGEIIEAKEFLFHPNCFACCVCQITLTDDNFSSLWDKNKNIYCKDDFYKKFSLKCFGCKCLIIPNGKENSSRIKALGKDWHTFCFKCDSCQIILYGNQNVKCYPLNGLPYCLACYKVSQK